MRLIKTTHIEIVSHGDKSDLICPDCGDYLAIMRTEYGWYATCRQNRKRWTFIEGDTSIAAETWSPMNDRDRLTGLPKP